MGNTSVVCVGDSTVDRFFSLDKNEAELLWRHNEKEVAFPYGEKISIEHYFQSYGGSAINTSIGLSKLRLDSYAATIVGEDNDGKDIITFLSQNGVNSGFVQAEKKTNQSAILIYQSERTIFSFHEERDYEKIKIPGANLIYLCSAGRGFEKMLPSITSSIKQGAKIALNPGSAELENFEKLSEIVASSEVLFLNKEEAEMLFAAKEIKDLLRIVLETGTKTAVITDGANGSYFATRDGNYHMGIAPCSLVDSTGAGDAFASGFLGAFAKTLSLEESAKWGMLNSASVVGKIGANAGLLSAEEISERSVRVNTLKLIKI